MEHLVAVQGTAVALQDSVEAVRLTVVQAVTRLWGSAVALLPIRLIQQWLLAECFHSVWLVDFASKCFEKGLGPAVNAQMGNWFVVHTS